MYHMYIQDHTVSKSDILFLYVKHSQASFVGFWCRIFHFVFKFSTDKSLDFKINAFVELAMVSSLFLYIRHCLSCNDDFPGSEKFSSMVITVVA